MRISSRVARKLFSSLGPKPIEWLGRISDRLDFLRLRAWETSRFLFHRPPGDGEMTAILLRNGLPGFRQYVFGQMLGQFGRRNFLPGAGPAVAARFQEMYPQEAKRALAVADRILVGEFDLLGSGPTDMRRGRGTGAKIDWTKDPISKERYRRIFCNWRFSPIAMRRGNADVKGPWELTRAQHFAALGQAYWITGDESYARCYADTITDFLRRNPPAIGIHWACTMDVSLRVVGWLVGLSFFQGSPALSERWWRRFLKGLVEHGRFIVNNLEFGTLDGRIIVSNHGLADLFGLYWLALNFPGLDAGCVWRGIAETGLEREVRAQILADGGDFESSIPYHRLVTEMFLSAYALSRHHNLPLSNGYRDRVLGALRFVKALRRPDGGLPQVGDADNGRGHVFTGYGHWERQQENMDHLLAAGATVLNCPSLAEDLPQESLVEQLFWRHPDDPEPPLCAFAPVPNPCLLPDSGLAVLRGGPSYVMLSNSVSGTLGIGNHKHNDQLAIEWTVGEQPLLVDSGSYTYTQDPGARNAFRSTAVHNTVMADGEEQNILDPAALFRLQQAGEPFWKSIHSDDRGAGVWAGHTAYDRLNPPLGHERRLLTLFEDGVVVVDDLFEGAMQHTLRWHFLLYPGTDARISEGKVFLTGAKGGGVIDAGGALEWKTEKGWYSGGYGSRTETLSLVAERNDGPERVTIVLSPFEKTAEDHQLSPDYHALKSLADEFWASSSPL